jgi:hypothetical protein
LTASRGSPPAARKRCEQRPGGLDIRPVQIVHKQDHRLTGPIARRAEHREQVCAGAEHRALAVAPYGQLVEQPIRQQLLGFVAAGAEHVRAVDPGSEPAQLRRKRPSSSVHPTNTIRDLHPPMSPGEGAPCVSGA